MLKFEGKFKEGQTIKAMDFASRLDCYIIGTVLEELNKEQGFHAYKIKITKRVWRGAECPEEVGDDAWIPHGVGEFDYDTRITLVE